MYISYIPYITHYSSFDFLFHDSNIAPIYYVTRMVVLRNRALRDPRAKVHEIYARKSGDPYESFGLVFRCLGFRIRVCVSGLG